MFNFSIYSISLSFTDYPRAWQLSFQKPATTMMEGIIDLHHDIFTFLVIIFVFVSFMLGTILFRYPARFNVSPRGLPSLKFITGHGITHNTTLEIVWTIIPTLVLLLIATPSFALIYALDEIVEPELTLRVVGRQWYWTYEFPDSVSFGLPSGEYYKQFLAETLLPSAKGPSVSEKTKTVTLGPGVFNKHFDQLSREELFRQVTKAGTGKYKEFSSSPLYTMWLELKEGFASLSIPGFSFNSYIVATEDLFPGSFRLLEVDRRLVLPFATNIRVLVTSYDVIHSWTVPSFGIKVDALPGRLNEYYLNINYLGLFYGQCSEICGVNHGFIPIKVEVTTEDQFKWWFLRTSLLENNALRFRNIFENIHHNPQNELEKFTKKLVPTSQN
jgi:heme/copper-type cytochrome/quinol oxidase subunit 2